MTLISKLTLSFKLLIFDMLTWIRLALVEVGEVMAGHNVGQMILRQVDNILWVIEKSSQWSLPPPVVDGEKLFVSSELTRPLPWILFLPTLIFLRIVREFFSFGALMLGEEPLRPVVIMKYIQNCRRSLRAIKYQGMRNMREKQYGEIKNQDERQNDNENPLNWNSRIVSKLQSLMCYNVAKFPNGKSDQLPRKNSGDKILIFKSNDTNPRKRTLSADEDLDDDDCCELEIECDQEFNDLVSQIHEFAETDSEDSDFSLKKESDEYLNTSATSSDEDTDEEIEEEEEEKLNDEEDVKIKEEREKNEEKDTVIQSENQNNLQLDKDSNSHGKEEKVIINKENDSNIVHLAGEYMKPTDIESKTVVHKPDGSITIEDFLINGKLDMSNIGIREIKKIVIKFIEEERKLCTQNKANAHKSSKDSTKMSSQNGKKKSCII